VVAGLGPARGDSTRASSINGGDEELQITEAGVCGGGTKVGAAGAARRTVERGMNLRPHAAAAWLSFPTPKSKRSDYKQN
jgi:hypothetical protein